MMKDHCMGMFGLRCNFEPRYDEGEPRNFKYEGAATAEGMARILDAAKSITYVCDVCTSCGEQRQRPHATEKAPC